MSSSVIITNAFTFVRKGYKLGCSQERFEKKEIKCPFEHRGKTSLTLGSLYTTSSRKAIEAFDCLFTLFACYNLATCSKPFAYSYIA